MSYEHDVVDFHKKFKHPCPDKPRRPAESWVEFRKKLIIEEAEELCEAIESCSLVKIAREAMDLIYVVIGTMVAFGLPIRRSWSAVHKANMRKEYAGPRKKPKKPKGWEPPDLAIDEAIKECLDRR